MNEVGAADDLVRRYIGLGRTLCQSDSGSDEHQNSENILLSLCASGHLGERLNLDGLRLWSIWSREKSSSAVINGNIGHIILDGLQLQVLRDLLDFMSSRQNPSELAPVIIDHICDTCILAGAPELAAACTDALLRNGFVVRHAQEQRSHELADKHFVQRQILKFFVIGHEIGHLLLAKATDGEMATYTQVGQALTEEAIRHLRTARNPPSESEGRWSLVVEDLGFRDELLCDMTGTDVVEIAVDQLGGANTRQREIVFESVYFTIFALDVMRFIKTFTSGRQLASDEDSTDTFLGKHLVRATGLNLLLQARLKPNREFVEGLTDQINRTMTGDLGLFSIALSLGEAFRSALAENETEENNTSAPPASPPEWKSNNPTLLTSFIALHPSESQKPGKLSGG